MKQLVILSLLFTTAAAYGAGPSTSCPSGFVAVNEPYLTIENGSCPTGTTSVGAASTCLASSPSGSCMMYAPTGTTYTDTAGSYEFTSVCPLS